MSGSRNYTVTVNVKDGGMLKQLEALQKGSPMNGKAAGGSSGGGIFNRLQELGNNQLLKLAGISIGVGSLVSLATKSSGILQSSLKLLETTFMLVLKPFGDFLGLALRPLTIMLLAWAIPFYKVAGPFFRDFGTSFGEFLADPIGHMNETTAEINDAITDALGTASDQLSQAGNSFWDSLVSSAESIWTTLSNTGAMLWGLFVSIGESIWQKLSVLPQVFYGYLSSIGSMIWDGLASIPSVFTGIFTGLASALHDALADVPELIRKAVVSAITSHVGSGQIPAGGTALGGFAGLIGSSTRTAAVADTLE